MYVALIDVFLGILCCNLTNMQMMMMISYLPDINEAHYQQYVLCVHTKANDCVADKSRQKLSLSICTER